MLARKRLIILTDVTDAALRKSLQREATTPKDSDAMLKDAHLLEAALASDRLITSLDDAARALFAGAAGNGVHKIKSIMWMNPGTNRAAVFAWLAAGSKEDRTTYLLP
jgi:hypothetical protein